MSTRRRAASPSIPQRVRYYRLNACARLGPRFGLADMGEGTTRPLGPAGAVDAAVDRYADGSGMVMNMLHRRMRLTAQADAIGVELPGREVDDEAPPLPHTAIYDVGARATARHRRPRRRPCGVEPRQGRGPTGEVPARSSTATAPCSKHASSTTSAASSDRTPTTLAAGRVELATAARDGTVELDDYLLYHWARLTRDDWMMREASGGMYERGWPELVG